MRAIPRFGIIGLDGQVETRFETRECASIRCAQLNAEIDTEKQDLEDKEFCAKYGVPFQPRRYFVMEGV